MNRYSTVKVVNTWTGADGVQHSDIAHPVFVSRLQDLASNAGELYEPGTINNLCIFWNDPEDIRDPAKKGRIFQAGGYSARRGLFVDEYGADGRRIT